MESVTYLGEHVCGVMQVNSEDNPYRNIKKSAAEIKPSVEMDKVVKITLVSLTIKRKKGWEPKTNGLF